MGDSEGRVRGERRRPSRQGVTIAGTVSMLRLSPVLLVALSGCMASYAPPPAGPAAPPGIAAAPT